MREIKLLPNKMRNHEYKGSKLMSIGEVEKARAFHKSFPEYEETPLTPLKNLANNCGLKSIYVKDESFRFRLNAFKVLGGAYAMAKFIAKKLGKDISELSYDMLISDELKNSLGDITFYTATDGNHGRGIAWAAKKLRQKAVIYMPDGSSLKRRDSIREEGALCEIISGSNYDDCVRLAALEAEKVKGGVVVQDTAWEGYEEIPKWIMQGYGTMALEAAKQMEAVGERPSHIFVQAGVGSFAGAVAGFFTNYMLSDPPFITVVEPSAADCLYKSSFAGKRAIVEGELRTIMAGLSCGEPNPISWEILRETVDLFVSCPDYVSAKGMRILSSPLGDDKRVISGESGAVGLGFLVELMTNNNFRDLRDKLHLSEESRVLLFSTEGATDPDMYRSIVWDGEFSYPGNKY